MHLLFRTVLCLLLVFSGLQGNINRTTYRKNNVTNERLNVTANRTSNVTKLNLTANGTSSLTKEKEEKTDKVQQKRKTILGEHYEYYGTGEELLEKYEPPESWRKKKHLSDNFARNKYERKWLGSGEIGVALVLSSGEDYTAYMKIAAVKWVFEVANKFNYFNGFKLRVCQIYFSKDVRKHSLTIYHGFTTSNCLMIMAEEADMLTQAMILQQRVLNTFIHVFGRRNKNHIQSIYREYFVTFTVPSDYMRSIALAELIRKLNINILGIIQSSVNSPASNFFVFSLMSEKLKDICIAFKFSIYGIEREKLMKESLQIANDTTPLKTLILFLDEEDSKLFIRTLVYMKLAKRFLLIFVYPTIRNPYVAETMVGNFEGYFELQKHIQGAITIDIEYKEFNEFKNFYRKFYTYTKKELKEMRNRGIVVFECLVNFSEYCTADYYVPIEGYGDYKAANLNGVINAANIIVQKVNRLVYHECVVNTKKNNDDDDECWMVRHINSNSLVRTFDFLKDIYLNTTDNLSYTNITTSWDSNFQYPMQYHFEYLSLNAYNSTSTIYDLDKFGSWKTKEMKDSHKIRSEEEEFYYVFKNELYESEINLNDLHLPDEDKAIEEYTRCSLECKDGYRKVQDPKFRSCCWQCLKCPKPNSYVVDDKCFACNPNEKPNHLMKKCIELPKVYLTRENFHWKIITGIWGALCMLTFLSIVFFIKNYKVFKIVASRRPLFWLLTTGVLMLIVSLHFLFFIQVTSTICRIRLSMILSAVSLISLFSFGQVLPEALPNTHKMLLGNHFVNFPLGIVAMLCITNGSLISLVASYSNLRFLSSSDQSFAFGICGAEVESNINIASFLLSILCNLYGMYGASKKLYDQEKKLENISYLSNSSLNILGFIFFLYILQKEMRSEDYFGEVLLVYACLAFVFVCIVTVYFPLIYSVWTWKTDKAKLARSKSTSSSYPMNPLLVENNANINIQFDMKVDKF